MENPILATKSSPPLWLDRRITVDDGKTFLGTHWSTGGGTFFSVGGLSSRMETPEQAPGPSFYVRALRGRVTNTTTVSILPDPMRVGAALWSRVGSQDCFPQR